MSRSKKLFNDSKKVIPSGVNSPVRYYEPYPFFTKKSDGAYIWDEDKNKYIDLCNAYGALLLGHRRKEIIQSVSKQLTRGTLFCTPTESEIELSKLIIKNFPSINKVRLLNTGGEATMTAIRLVRGFTKKKKIIKFEGGYHGAHDSVLVKAGSGAAHDGISISDGGLDEVSRNTLVVPYNNYEELENTITKNKDIAGVIIEPILANMGLILPQNNFLTKVRKITKDNDIPLIFDEVVTGFRVSPGGAQTHYGIKPDLTTLAKAMGNGFVIAAIGGKKEIMDLLSPKGKVYQASTYAGNPISVSAAIATIKTINKIKNKLYSKLEKTNNILTKTIDDMATDLKIPHQINSTSSMFQIFFTNNPVIDYVSSKTSDIRKFKKIFETLLKKGVFIPPSQFEVVFLSDAYDEIDLKNTINAYDMALKSVKK
ncbi:MAG: glutamate-1-semialdehyde 2,1-aminomutase [Nitrosarchaeum sp.]|nr:glutamate-1-semialdehyde 2,1-aminomutase [Nitrosarchaeum sp.]MBP0120663.1 glutamate-1-semialdehyde 2,1-aminomutase [Nitrosarchaeum sp.]MBP0134193.1 glutamate-1-semialdehyde 2,1-aminomutase [Nitrosarchaeum sp.]